MKSLTFGAGIVLAAVLSVTGAAVALAVNTVVGYGWGLRVLLPLLSLGYLLFLIRVCRVRFGASLMLLGWLLLSALFLLLNPGPAIEIAGYVFLLWICRSAIRYHRVLPAMADGGLNLLALCAAVSVAVYSYSLLLSLWSFFLAQAFCVMIPGHGQSLPPSPSCPENRFDQARHSAENALRRLQRPSTL